MSRIKKKFLRLGTGVDELNSQDIPANFTPSNYTPAQVGSEGTGKISAHLKGIDAIIASGGGSGITALTGDVLASGTGSVNATISSGAVTLDKMFILSPHTYIGNNTPSSATPLAVTSTQLTADLDAATTSLQGMMSSSDKTKLDGIASDANDYVHPNHSGEVTSLGDGATTISATGKTAVLSSKLVASRDAVLGKMSGTGSTVQVDEVTGVLTTNSRTTDLTGLGAYVGTVSGAADWLRVQIRANGTDNGFDDGTGDEVYGVLSWDGAHYNLAFKTHNNSSFSFGTSTSIDFYFVEVFDLSNAPLSLGMSPVAGVVDATTASTITNHINNTTGAHAGTAISYTRVSGKKNVQGGTIQVTAAINDIDDAIGILLSPTNYTPSGATVTGHFQGIDTALSTSSLKTKIGDATESVNGLMNATDKTKLDELTAERTMANPPLYRDYSTSPLTGGVWNQLVASTTLKATKIHVFDSSGTPWYLAYGAVSSEVAQIIIPPGGDTIEILIPQSTRLSAQTADGSTVSEGTLLISFLT